MASASRSAQDCRDQAERLRRLAAKAKSPAVRRDYQELASEWDMMADQVEKFLRDKVTPNRAALPSWFHLRPNTVVCGCSWKR
jgi:hypothetical protein